MDEEVLIEKILEQRTERAEPCRNKPDSDTGRRDSTCKGPEAAVCLLGSRKAQETSGSGTRECRAHRPWPEFWGWLCRPLGAFTAE